jgi:hypothetical protein
VVTVRIESPTTPAPAAGDPDATTIRRFVESLLDVEASPVVTVTVALDRRAPGSDEDRIRFKNLLAAAEDRIAGLADGAVAGRLLDHLRAAAGDVTLGGGAHGVVLVATPESGVARRLPFPVRDDVSLASTPATRYLVQGLRRSPRYRVRVVSDRATRLYEAVRDELVEVTDHGFPMTARILRRDRRATAGPFALAPGRDDKEQKRRFYREVDAALTEASRGDALPIVLVGVRTSTLLFRSVTTHTGLVAGSVDGAHDRLAAGELGRLVWPVLREELKRRRAEAIADLSRAVARGGAVTGIDEVWQLGREGRGRLLVVEETYRAQPAREVDGRLVPAGDADEGVLADPVDEIVEHVLRAGGAVEFVAADALADRGRIGLVLR